MMCQEVQIDDDEDDREYIRRAASNFLIDETDIYKRGLEKHMERFEWPSTIDGSGMTGPITCSG
jgi:hypothetical protein